MSTVTIYSENDNVLSATITDAVTGASINDATVTVTLQHKSGSEISGETWPLSMTYVTASDGVYRATLADTLSLQDGRSIEAVINIDAGAGKTAKKYQEVKVERRI